MKKRLLQFLVNNFAALSAGAKQIELNRVKSLPNVEIDNSLSMEDYCSIAVYGPVKLFKIAKNVSTRKYVSLLINPGGSLIINDNVFLNNYCSISCLGYIEIGENSIFGEGVKLYDHNHKYNFQDNKLNVERADFTVGKITIGKNCWIGSNVTILNNVEIGDNVIIGANCLIYKSVAANSIVKHSEQLVIN